MGEDSWEASETKETYGVLWGLQVNRPPKEWRGDGARGAFFGNHGGAVRFRAERFG